MNIFVSNLSSDTTGDVLQQLFMPFGQVKSVLVVSGKPPGGPDTGRHAYVEMAIKAEGAHAITNLHGSLISGRVISTIEALPLSKKRTTELVTARRGRRAANPG